MSDNDSEKGWKWWLRYVVVPLLGSAVVAALINAYIARPKSPTNTAPSESSAKGAQSSDQEDQNKPSGNKIQSDAYMSADVGLENAPVAWEKYDTRATENWVRVGHRIKDKWNGKVYVHWQVQSPQGEVWLKITGDHHIVISNDVVQRGGTIEYEEPKVSMDFILSDDRGELVKLFLEYVP